MAARRRSRQCYPCRILASGGLRRRISSQFASGSRPLRLLVRRIGLLDLLRFALHCCLRYFRNCAGHRLVALWGYAGGGAARLGGRAPRVGALAAGTALLVSLIAFIAWLAKAGVMVHFISESVMTGFKSGVALFLASTQLPKLFGFHSAHGSFWENTGFFFKHLSEMNPMSVLVGGIAL